MIIRPFLTGHKIDISTAITKVMNDDNVIACWSLMSYDLDDTESDDLLSKVIELWIIIRGHAYASNLIEQYKQIIKSTDKKALRKSLKLGAQEETK